MKSENEARGKRAVVVARPLYLHPEQGPERHARIDVQTLDGSMRSYMLTWQGIGVELGRMPRSHRPHERREGAGGVAPEVIYRRCWVRRLVPLPSKLTRKSQKVGRLAKGPAFR